jgi:hypothetical protein
MNTTIRFLETLGQNSKYRHLNTAQLNVIAEEAGLSNGVIRALLTADDQSLSKVMCTNPKGCFVFVLADEDSTEIPVAPFGNNNRVENTH